MNETPKGYIGEALRILDVLLFAPEEERDLLIVRSRKNLMHAMFLIEVAEMPAPQLPEVRPVEGRKSKKPKMGRPPATPGRPNRERQIEALAIECPTCAQPPGELCLSVGPLNTGKVMTRMHKSRAGTVSVPNRHPDDWVSPDPRPVVES